MQMHVYKVTWNFAKGSTTTVLKPGSDTTCNVPNPYDKEKGYKSWLKNNGRRLVQLTIKWLIKVITLINITKVALLN